MEMPAPRKRTFKNDVPCSVLLPEPLQRVLADKAHREDLTFSQIVRRALRKEVGTLREATAK